MIHTDTDSRPILLTYPEKGDHFGAYFFQFLSVLLIGIDQLCESLLLVYKIAGINTYFFGNSSGDLCCTGIKMDVGRERGDISLVSQLLMYFT
ncbi:hypothetical protein SDC9_113659 [bioreactor metagenome]|uniref:Uncharacterized protein n=1 Tax=bioreactor metagenome TaxID=1076179 RepID=A0A645BNQ2_9ZZZZ